jgi:hypothetical protein
MPKYERDQDRFVDELIKKEPQLAKYREQLIELVHDAIDEVGCDWPSCQDGG